MPNRSSRRIAAALAGLAVFLTSAVAGPAAARARVIEGVAFADRVTLGDVELPLRGLALLRYKVLFRGYVAALYLPPGTDSDSVLADIPRRLDIEYFWSIPANLFAEATVDGIRKNVSSERFEALAPRIERFNELYADVRPGDRYQVSYQPGVGTELFLNGELRGRIAGADFAGALFSIWLGDEPFSESMKSQLLADPAGSTAPTG